MPSRSSILHGEGLVDRPPAETLEQWIERKRVEAEQRNKTKRSLTLVPSTDE